MPDKDHHCSYQMCKKSKSKCTDHYWTCTGCDGAVHPTQRIFQKKSCESNLRITKEDSTEEVVICENTHMHTYLDLPLH
jgi:hypothetical protein